MTDDTKIRIEAERRMDALGLTGEARAEARPGLMAAIRHEQATEATEANAQADTAAERARIRSVVRLGIDHGKGGHALAAALAAPISVEAARHVMASLPTDAETPAALPAVGTFGTEAAQAERRRIAGCFARPEAAGRFAATFALAVEGSEALTGEQVAPLLAMLPMKAETERHKSIAERAAQEKEIGADPVAPGAVGSRADDVWSKTIQQMNATFGTPTPSAAPALPEGAAQ